MKITISNANLVGGSYCAIQIEIEL